MVRPRLTAAALAVAIVSLSAGPAAAANGALVAQLAQVAQDPAPGGQPELRERVPGLPDGDDGGDPGQPEPGPEAEPTPELPATGSETAVLLLGGLGLLAAGAGLRLSVDALGES